MDEQVTGPSPSQGRARRTSRKDSTRSSASLGALLRHAGLYGVLVFVVAVAGAVTLIVAEQSVIYEVDPARLACEDQVVNPEQRDQCVTKGYEQHSHALNLLGVIAILLAFGAGLARVRIAAMALIVIGAVVLAIALLGDLPDTDKTGQLAVYFDEAETNPGPGLTLEIVGGVLLVAAGVLGLARQR